jgi:virginiamycin B lyase
LNACGGGSQIVKLPSPLIPSPSAGAPAVSQIITSGITPNAGLVQAVAGPDRRVWFSEFNTNKLAAVTLTGSVTEYPMPASSQPNGITVGADANIWAGGFGNGQIFRVAVNGATTAFSIAHAHIGSLTLGPDNNVWFADLGNDTVGNITPLGGILTYPMPAGAAPLGIATGSDGNLWVTDANGSILRVAIDGAFTQYKAGISVGASPQQIAAGSDGDLYFTEPFFNPGHSDHIGRITTSGIITELGALAPNTTPSGITAGKDGNIYFTEAMGSSIGMVAVSSGAVTELRLNVAHGGAIVNGPDNNLWAGGVQTIYKISY